VQSARSALAVGKCVFAVRIALAVSGGRAVDAAAVVNLGDTGGTERLTRRNRRGIAGASSAENICRPQGCGRKTMVRSRPRAAPVRPAVVAVAAVDEAPNGSAKKFACAGACASGHRRKTCRTGPRRRRCGHEDEGRCQRAAATSIARGRPCMREKANSVRNAYSTNATIPR